MMVKVGMKINDKRDKATFTKFTSPFTSEPNVICVSCIFSVETKYHYLSSSFQLQSKMPSLKVSKDYETPAWMNEFVYKYKAYVRAVKCTPGITIAMEDNRDVRLLPEQCLQFFKRLAESKGERTQDQTSNSGQDEDNKTPQPFPRKNKQGYQKTQSNLQSIFQNMAGNGIATSPTPLDFDNEENWEKFTYGIIPPRDETMRKGIVDQERIWRHQTERDRFDGEGILQDVCSRKVFEMEKFALKNAEKPRVTDFLGPFVMPMTIIQDCVKKSMKMKMDRREFEKHSLKTELDYEKIIIAKEFSETRKKLEEGINYIGKVFKFRDIIWNMERAENCIEQILRKLTDKWIIQTEVGLFKLESTMDPKAPFPVDLQIAMHHLATALEGLQKILELCPVGKYESQTGPRKVIYNIGRISLMDHLYQKEKEYKDRNYVQIAKSRGGYLMARDCVPGFKTSKNGKVKIESKQKKSKSPLKLKKYVAHQGKIDVVLRDIKESNAIPDLKDWDWSEFRMNVTTINSYGFSVFESAVLLNKFDNKPDKVIKYLRQVMM